MKQQFEALHVTDSPTVEATLSGDARAPVQNVLRSAMADAAGRLRDLECRRVTAIKGIVCSFLSSYP
jgi:hypothetical protein